MKGIEISIGRVCNNDCLFCGNGENGPDKPAKWADADAVISEIGEASRAGYDSIGFLGGEITVYPGAMRILDASRDAGFKRIMICTNGRRFEDAGLLDKFLGAGVTRISLSIHSHEAAVENYLNNRKDAFRQKEAAIRNCVAAEKAGRIADGFSLNACIHGLNWKVLAEGAAFFRSLGVRDIRYNSLRPDRKALNNRELVPRFTDVMEAIVALIVANEKSLHMTVTFGDIPLCVWPETFLRQARLARNYVGELRDLDTSVTVLATESKPTDRFKWKERKVGMLKQYMEQCKTCAANAACEGVWTDYVDIYGVGEFRPIKGR
jgi:MoaA/NifB/PqqE/SkfB family radical SAM enzyme